MTFNHAEIGDPGRRKAQCEPEPAKRKRPPQLTVTVRMSGQSSHRSRKTLQRKCLI